MSLSPSIPEASCPACAKFAQLVAFIRERQEQQHAESQARIAALEAEIAKLRGQLGMNSSNSHKPPSTDSPKDQAKKNNSEVGVVNPQR